MKKKKKNANPWCNMLQTLETRRKYAGIILSNELRAFHLDVPKNGLHFWSRFAFLVGCFNLCQSVTVLVDHFGVCHGIKAGTCY